MNRNTLLILVAAAALIAGAVLAYFFLPPRDVRAVVTSPEDEVKVVYR